MALSTLRIATRSFLFTQQSGIFNRCGALAMSSTAGSLSLNKTSVDAHNDMKKFWKKNQDLKRPNSPWVIYRPHMPMLTSLCHRATGITMGIVLYATSITVFLAPGDMTSYVEFLKNLSLSPAILFPAKTICAFPLVYHYINGIRHLAWDAGYGYELKTQYKTGTVIVLSAITVSALLASIAYW